MASTHFPRALAVSVSTVLALTSVTTVATPALADRAAQLTQLNGLQAGGVESALRSRGFTHIASHRNSMGYTYAYWWDNGDNTCVRTEVYGGNVESIVDATAADCNQTGGGGNNNAGAAVAVAGLAILGAALASRSHHREGNDFNAQQTAQFDRGYTDGLHGAAYHNYDRSDAYSNGYQVGTDERSANLSHHSGRGGYQQFARFDDLQGARAAGATDELGRRGFRQVDNFASGNARYGIYWNSGTHQCLQAITANGRLEDIRDIGQHPNCRG